MSTILVCSDLHNRLKEGRNPETTCTQSLTCRPLLTVKSEHLPGKWGGSGMFSWCLDFCLLYLSNLFSDMFIRPTLSTKLVLSATSSSPSDSRWNDVLDKPALPEALPPAYRWGRRRLHQVSSLWRHPLPIPFYSPALQSESGILLDGLWALNWVDERVVVAATLHRRVFLKTFF